MASLASFPAWLMLALLCAVWGGAVQATPARGADGAPSIYLEQANVPRAKALALDAALIKGWRVAASGRDYSIFETMVRGSDATLDDDSADGESAPRSVLLRIRADFSRDAGGVRVSLVATEISAPGTQAARERDVTQDYRANLDNALASLRQQWDDFARGGRPSRQPPGANGADVDARAGRASQTVSESPRPLSRPIAPDPPRPTGQWSYEAEKLAARHGCKVSSRGATLLGDRASSRDSGHEVHRVSCDNRSALLVRCDSEGCGLAR